jgi:hypothetical protein
METKSMDNAPLRGGEAVPAVQQKGNGVNISKIIDGLRYNTATAEKICTFESDAGRGDFHHEVTSLYRTPNGMPTRAPSPASS